MYQRYFKLSSLVADLNVNIHVLCLNIDAIRRFFQTKIEEAALKEKGTYDAKVQKQRRRNRIMKVLFIPYK